MYISFTYWAYKASVMPSVAQSFKKPVSSFNGEFTAMAHGTEEGIVICKQIQSDFKAEASAEKQDWPFETIVLFFQWQWVYTSWVL